MFLVSTFVLFDIHAFFLSNTFISNARLKLAKNQAKASQQIEDEFLLFENYLLSLTTLSCKNERDIQKMHKKQVRLFKWGYMINGNENEANNEK